MVNYNCNNICRFFCDVLKHFGCKIHNTYVYYTGHYKPWDECTNINRSKYNKIVKRCKEAENIRDIRSYICIELTYQNQRGFLFTSGFLGYCPCCYPSQFFFETDSEKENWGTQKYKLENIQEEVLKNVFDSLLYEYEYCSVCGKKATHKCKDCDIYHCNDQECNNTKIEVVTKPTWGKCSLCDNEVDKRKKYLRLCNDCHNMHSNHSISKEIKPKLKIIPKNELTYQLDTEFYAYYFNSIMTDLAKNNNIDEDVATENILKQLNIQELTLDCNKIKNSYNKKIFDELLNIEKKYDTFKLAMNCEINFGDIFTYGESYTVVNTIYFKLKNILTNF